MTYKTKNNPPPQIASIKPSVAVNSDLSIQTPTFASHMYKPAI